MKTVVSGRGSVVSMSGAAANVVGAVREPPARYQPFDKAQGWQPDTRFEIRATRK